MKTTRRKAATTSRPSRTAKPAPIAYQWDGETFTTREACEKAIERMAARLLCDGDCGSVEVGATEAEEGETVGLAIRVAVLTPDGDAAEAAREAGPELLAALTQTLAQLESITAPLESCDLSPETEGAIDAARAAIAKSTPTASPRQD